MPPDDSGLCGERSRELDEVVLFEHHGTRWRDVCSTSPAFQGGAHWQCESSVHECALDLELKCLPAYKWHCEAASVSCPNGVEVDFCRTE